MKPLLIVRHAQARHHVEDLTGGWTDTELTPLGVRQSGLLADRLKEMLNGRPVLLASSDLRRALQTAEILGQALGAPMEEHPGLRDLNNGVAAGKTSAQARRHRLEPSEPLEDWRPYPHAETWREFSQRVGEFLQAFTGRLGERPEEAAVLVTHAANVRAIATWWLRLGLETRMYLGAAPASLTVLFVSKWGERAVERLNDTAHLFAAGMGTEIRLPSDVLPE